MGYRVGSFNRSEASAAVPQSKLGISPAKRKHVLSKVEGTPRHDTEIKWIVLQEVTEITEMN